MFKINKQQPGAWIDTEVTQRVEKEVTGKIRHCQRTVFIKLDKTRLAAAMRYINALAGTRVCWQVRRRDKEGIAVQYQGKRCGIQLL